jgi:hypothetical protein
MHLITHFYEDLGDINFDMSVDFWVVGTNSYELEFFFMNHTPIS